MEKMFFDPENLAFLSAKSHKGKIPNGALPVSSKRYAELLTAQRETDAQIIADENGKPTLLYPDTKSRMELHVGLIKQEARRRIEAIFPLTAQINALRMGFGNDPRFAIIDAIRAASNMIEVDVADCGDVSSYPIVGNPLWPEVN